MAAACLAGCAASGTPNVEGDYSPIAGKGLFVASVAASGYLPGELWMQIVPSGDTSTTAASILVNQEAHGDGAFPQNAALSGYAGRLAVVELAPGYYEVRRWVMNERNTATYVSRHPFGYRFTIESGKATYVGSIHLDIQKSAGRSLPYRITLNDRSARDLERLRASYPRLPAEAVVVAPADRAPRERAPSYAPPGVGMDELEDLMPRERRNRP